MFPRIRTNAILLLAFGILLGYRMAWIARPSRTSLRIISTHRRYSDDRSVVAHEEAKSELDTDSMIEWENTQQDEPVDMKNKSNSIKFVDSAEHKDDAAVALALFSSVRVLCWVMTSSTNLRVRAVHVKATWGRRCNVLLFMSEEDDPEFPAVGLGVEPGRSHLTAKTMRAFDYVYRHHYDDADWFLKADDDTYLIIENLRYLLSAHVPTDPVYFGHMFKAHIKQGYCSGGAGYVLSKEALRRYSARSAGQCTSDGGPEDLEMGHCLEQVGVRIQNSRDRLNRSRFHALKLRDHLRGDFPEWYTRYDPYSDKKGMEWVSDYPISFHYIKPDDMYTLEYFTYHAAVHGVLRGFQHLNPINNNIDKNNDNAN